MLCLCLVSLQGSTKPTEEMCLATVAMREASGESLAGARSILTVVFNRMRIDSMTACGVVTAPGQFSWYRKGYKWKLSRKDLLRYRTVRTLPDKLGPDVYYFNSGKRRKIGRYCKRVGRHHFYLLDRKRK